MKSTGVQLPADIKIDTVSSFTMEADNIVPSVRAQLNAGRPARLAARLLGNGDNDLEINAVAVPVDGGGADVKYEVKINSSDPNNKFNMANYGTKRVLCGREPMGR